MKINSYLISLLLLFIIACGSSSGGNNNNQPYTIDITGLNNSAALVGESVGLVLIAPESDITNINWTQTAGPTVTFLAGKTKVIGFDIAEIGDYSFNVSFTDSSGNSRSHDYTFTATNESEVYINARLDHEVNAQGKVSINVYENFPGTVSNFTWTQIAGPSVTIDNSNNSAIYFTAPAITGNDSLIQFSVEATDDLGNQASDIVNVLIESELIDPDRFLSSGRFEGISFADVYPYRPSSQYANVLKECVYSNTMKDYCNFGKLPNIGRNNSSITIDEVMDRVLVSHDWMGERFRNFLEQVDTFGDIRNLLGATTSIVISFDVKPSFYWAGTGAIHIDPNYFWVTPQERDTVGQTPDFRSNFDEELQFQDPWRVVKDNDYAYLLTALEDRLSRSLEESQFFVLRVFYHELAHANDFLPPRVWNTTSSSDYAWSYWDSNGSDSNGLSSAFPLSSNEMFGLASVMFHGEAASTTQKNYTPQNVTNFFSLDDAVNTYNYSSIAEDYAMLTETFFMSYRYGVDYDAGITGLAPDYNITWAERGRVGHERIKPRVEYVVSRLLPSIDIQAGLASLPAPVLLQTGVNWVDSLVPPTQNSFKTVQPKSLREQRVNSMMFGKDFHSSLPKDTNTIVR
jgi:hypothetical protein